MAVLAAMLPKEFTITAETIINKPKQDVYNYIKIIKNQEKYSKRVMQDPNVKMTYTGTDGTVGFKAAWVSEDKNVGAGEQEIKNLVEGERVDMEIRFEKPFKSVANASTTLEAISPTQTKVINTYFGESAFPMNLMTVVLKPMLQKDMQ